MTETFKMFLSAIQRLDARASIAVKAFGLEIAATGLAGIVASVTFGVWLVVR